MNNQNEFETLEDLFDHFKAFGVTAGEIQEALEYSNEYGKLLEELEKAGWPCRLIELPEAYIKLGRQTGLYRQALHLIREGAEAKNGTGLHYDEIYEIAESVLKGDESIVENYNLERLRNGDERVF